MQRPLSNISKELKDKQHRGYEREGQMEKPGGGGNVRVKEMKRQTGGDGMSEPQEESEEGLLE